MGATVHSLFVPAAPEAPPAAAASADDGLCWALRDGSVEILDDLARQMLDNADDALFKMSETAGSDAERRQCFDTMRVLRLDRAGFSAHFSREIAASFDPAAQAAANRFDLSELSMQKTEELEERIAVGNLASRIEGPFAAGLLDLRRRLDAARARGVPIAAAALTPASICKAFGAALAALRAEFDIKLIVCKLFERVLCRDFDRLLRHALETLERHGFDAGSGSRAGAPASRAAASRPAGPASPPATPAPAWSEAMPQSAALPDSTRQLFNLLLARLSANPLLATVNSAVPSRPLPPAMAELVGMASEAAHDRQATARFDSLLESALAMTVHGGVQRPDDGLQGVVDYLREQLREQRQVLLRQVRGEIGRELDRRIAARELPASLLTLLRSGVGPLMAMRLLNGGRDSAGFRDADRLLDRVLDSLDIPRPPSEQDQQARAALLVDLRRALISVGMSEARAGLLIDGLIASWAQRDALPPPPPAATAATTAATAASPPLPAPAPAAATPAIIEGVLHPTSPALLARVLLPDTWFRVFDAARNQTRWLKVASYYAAEDLVRFTGIDDSTQLSLRASRLGSDLVDGRSEPINPSPDARAALDALRGAPDPTPA